MRPGPAAAATLIVTRIDLASPPRLVGDLIQEIGVAEGWFASAEEAAERAAQWEARVLTRLRQQLSEARERHLPKRFDFNESTPNMIQGHCFDVPTDSEALRLEKRNRALQDHYRASVLDLTPDEFESLSRGVLRLIGCADPTLTPRAGDQGIDVYGELSMVGRLDHNYLLGGPDRMMSQWIVGQAKHYLATVVDVDEMRLFIGSYELARHGVSTDQGAALAGLTAKPYEATHLVFLTTGCLTSGAAKVAGDSGVLIFDLDVITALLSDHCVASVDFAFSPEQFAEWVLENGRVADEED